MSAETRWPVGPYYLTADQLTVCSSVTDDDLADVFCGEDATVASTREQAVALAHLFAAAPDLYDALSAAREFIRIFTPREDHLGDTAKSHAIRIDALLAKARGE